MSIVTQLLEAPVAVHGDSADPALYTLNEASLRFIETHVGPGAATLETGCGYSTVVFAAHAASHTCVVPIAAQVETVRRRIAASGLDPGRVHFEVAPSERVLPALERDPLDVVLIDGSHAFPQVFIDWFYTADRLVLGGLLMVDDVHLWTGKVLRRFLDAEPGWERVALLGGRTAVFRKLAAFEAARDWTDQPFVARRSRYDVASQARVPLSLLREGRVREVATLMRRRVRGR